MTSRARACSRRCSRSSRARRPRCRPRVGASTRTRSSSRSTPPTSCSSAVAPSPASTRSSRAASARRASASAPRSARANGPDLGELYAQVLPEDLLKFGLIPEFIGRLPGHRRGRNLDQEALIRILVEPKNALVKQYQKFFEFEDVELEFTDDALAAVADQALLRGTGARGLRAILEEVLLERHVRPAQPRRRRARCVIDRDVVLEKVNPTLVPRAATPTPVAPAPRRVLTRAPAGGPPRAPSSSSTDHVDREARRRHRSRALSLDTMRRLVHVLGDPQHAYPVIHLTGTNGKGSVAADGHGAAGRARPDGRHLHEPPPRTDQRADLPQRRAHRRRRSGRRHRRRRRGRGAGWRRRRAGSRS